MKLLIILMVVRDTSEGTVIGRLLTHEATMIDYMRDFLVILSKYQMLTRMGLHSHELKPC